MSIFKFNPPNIPVKNNSGGGIDYSKLLIKIKKLQNLKNDLEDVLKLYDKFAEFDFLPISIDFSEVLAKSKRISTIFNFNQTNPRQIGSKYIFNKNNNLDTIRIVYSCNKKDIDYTIQKLQKIINVITPEIEVEINKINQSTYFDNKGKIKKVTNKEKSVQVENIIKNNIELWKLRNILYDFNYMEKIQIIFENKFSESPIITFYEIDSFKSILNKLENKGILIDENSIVANEFLNLDINLLNQIVKVYPFIFSSSNTNITIEPAESYNIIDQNPTILKNMKTIGKIGIIDSYARFQNGWEKYVEYNEVALPSKCDPDYDHGTQVGSLIIGRDILNPYFTDNLGFFKLIFFGVLSSKKNEINLFYFMRELEKIISNNNNIKIWNLSICGERHTKGISVLGKLLDKLQFKYNILFVISSGNLGEKKLSVGADSLTSLSVGALYETNNNNLTISKYTGTGTIFGIFEKPNTYDIGNDFQALDSSLNYLQTIDGNGFLTQEEGTSFAAPLIARKSCYLMEKYKINIETVRAVINYLTKISPYNLPNLEELKKNGSVFLFVEGIIKAKEGFEIPIELPKKFINKKSEGEFTVGFSIAYNIPNDRNIGDEYSMVDISLRFMQENKMNKGRKSLIKIKNSENIDGLNAKENDLRENFGKYDPNRVLIDKNFNDGRGIKLISNNKFILYIKRTDLFNDVNVGNINYGALIHFKETVEGSLSRFHIENKIYIKETIYLDEHVNNEIKINI